MHWIHSCTKIKMNMLIEKVQQYSFITRNN
jgi:hypothetical protein